MAKHIILQGSYLENVDTSNVAAVSQNTFGCHCWDRFESQVDAQKRISFIISNLLSRTLVLGMLQMTFYLFSEIKATFKSLPPLGIFKRLCCRFLYIIGEGEILKGVKNFNG